MGAFFKEHSYSMVRLFLNQIVMSVFGTVLCLSTMSNQTLLIASGLLGIGMLLFIDYNYIWEIGAKDKIRIDGGRMKPMPATGLFIAICGNIPNFLLTIAMGMGAIINTAAGQSVAMVCNPILRLLNGMYLGIIVTFDKLIYPDGSLLINTWWWFFIITVPVIVTGFLAYFLGSKGIRISAILGLSKAPESSNTKHY